MGNSSDDAELKPHERNYTIPQYSILWGTSIGGLLDEEFTQLYDVVPGEGELMDRRIRTVVEMYKLLQEKGSAEKSDFLEVVDLDAVEYSSLDLAWSNMVEGQDTLSALPCVEKPPKGQTTWTYNY